MQDNEDSYLKRHLLSPPPSEPATPTDKVRIENEKKYASTTARDKKSEPDSRREFFMSGISRHEEETQVIELLKENPGLLLEPDADGRTPLHTLCILGDEEAPERLKVLLGVKEGSDFRVERGPALNAKDAQGCTPLHYAAKNRLPQLVEALLKYGTKAEVQNSKGDSALHLLAEGNGESALECAKIILQHDKDGSLINLENLDGLSPLHKAIQEPAPKMVELLLKKQLKLNLFALANLQKGRHILQYLCIEPGETDKTCETLIMTFNKAIVNACNSSQLNSIDQDGRTVLHISAIQGLPEITEILVADERVKVFIADKMKVDKKGTALHYAAENGSCQNGYKCAEHIITRKFTSVKDQTEYLSKMMDDTNMTLIYEECPLAIKGLMNTSFTERKKCGSSSNDEIVTDFGPITGYADPVEKKQQEMIYLKKALYWDYEIQKEILTHPLVQLFIVKKSHRLRAVVYGWLVWQFMWLTAFTLMVLSTYTGVIQPAGIRVTASSLALLYIIVSIINEAFEFSSVRGAYFTRLGRSNLLQWMRIGLCGSAIYPVLGGMDLENVEEIQPFKNCAAIGILLAYILSMRDIGRLHEEIGLVVEVLKQVVFQIVKVLLCCFPLLAGFTLAFVILFDDNDALNTSFPGPLIKVLVMMAGELEFNNTLKIGEEGGSEAALRNRAIRLFLFLSFLICVPVAFFNLLTGFALDRVIELRECAKVGKIAKQLEHIYFLESMLNALKKVAPNIMRNFNVTTKMVDGELKFETRFVYEEIQKLDRNTKTDTEKGSDFLATIRSIFGTELPPDVRHQIFALTSQNQQRDIKHK